MVFGSIQRDQDVAIEDPHLAETAALLQLGHDIAKHRKEQSRIDRVELGAYLAVAGDLGDAEQGLAVRPALTGLEMPLVCQEGWALHEERGKRGEREIGHRITRVRALPPVGQSLAVAQQRSEKAILDIHAPVESKIAFQGNPENRPDCQSCNTVAPGTHQADMNVRRIAIRMRQNGQNPTQT